MKFLVENGNCWHIETTYGDDEETLTGRERHAVIKIITDMAHRFIDQRDLEVLKLEISLEHRPAVQA